MFCIDSSNVIRQCNKICVCYLTFVGISHIKTTLETNAQTQIFGSCVTGLIYIFTHNQKVIIHFLQHPSVKEKFLYFDAAYSEFSSNNIVIYELTEISLIHTF